MCGYFDNFRSSLVCGLCAVCWDFGNFQSSVVCGLCAVCRDFENFQSSLVCGLCAVCWDFENFQSSLVCGLCTVWCVETLKIFKLPLCVGSVLCCVWRLWRFSYFPGVWGFDIFQSSPVCGLCGVVWGDFEIFSKFPCVWDFAPVLERLSFHKKSLYWGFSPVLERLVFSGQNPRWWRSKAVKKKYVDIQMEIKNIQDKFTEPI